MSWPLLSEAARDRLESIVRSNPFPVAVALAILAAHLAAHAYSGASRFGVPFNASPGNPPAFRNPAADAAPERWNRLVVSRWDAGQYVELGLRGYDHCPPRAATPYPAVGSPVCNLSFYPTYAFLGRLLSSAAHLPIDYALLAIALVASFLFLFLWTGPALVERMGLAETYISLLLLNVFTTGFTLVSPQTEPLTLVLTLGSFIALRRRWWLLAGFLAGATSAMRVTAVATGLACAAAIAVEIYVDAPPSRREWARRIAGMALSGWGAVALMTYHHFRFGDARAYLHAHEHAFRHEPSLKSLLLPKTEWLVHSMQQQVHEGVWLVLALIWFLLGHRQAMRRFRAPEQAFWYVLFLGVVGIASYGQVSIWLQGMNRYLLLALPLFFSMAALLRPRPLALAFWVLISAWHYWNVDMCAYTGGPGMHCLQVCHAITNP
jgi:hypothetical protein